MHSRGKFTREDPWAEKCLLEIADLVSPRNAKKKRFAMVELLASFPGRSWLDLQTEDLRGYFERMLRSGAAAATVVDKMKSIGDFYLIAHRDGALEANPLASIPVVKQLPRRQQREVSLKQFQDLIANLAILHRRSRHIKYYICRDMAWLHLFYYTGITLSELLALRVSDVDLMSEAIRVVNGDGSTRTIPLNEAALPLLLYLDLRVSENEFLIVNRQGERMMKQAIEIIFNKVAFDEDGKRHVFIYSLRHTYLMGLIAKGTSMVKMQKLLGFTRNDNTHYKITKLKLKGRKTMQWFPEFPRLNSD